MNWLSNLFGRKAEPPAPPPDHWKVFYPAVHLVIGRMMQEGKIPPGTIDRGDGPELGVVINFLPTADGSRRHRLLAFDALLRTDDPWHNPDVKSLIEKRTLEAAAASAPPPHLPVRE